MPKAYPSFEDTAERFLDGELTAVRENRFLNRIKEDTRLLDTLKEMIFARKAVLLYRQIIPPAKEFQYMRRRLMAEL